MAPSLPISITIRSAPTREFPSSLIFQARYIDYDIGDLVTDIDGQDWKRVVDGWALDTEDAPKLTDLAGVAQIPPAPATYTVEAINGRVSLTLMASDRTGFQSTMTPNEARDIASALAARAFIADGFSVSHSVADV